MRRKGQQVISAWVGLFSAFAALASVSIENAGTLQSAALPAFADMSGVSWCGSTNASFYVVRDGGAVVSNGCYLHRMSVELDNRGRMTTPPKLSEGILLHGAHDAEGIARDPLTGTIWISDEYDTSIREYDPETGRQTGNDVEIPAFVVKGTRSNLSLESLTISPDGRTMWTANEEALLGDGATAVASATGTVIRLIRFTRLDAFDPWKLSGMWAYRCDPVGKSHPVNSGVSDLCALPDGSLLVLERECSYETLGLTRIYRPSLAGATDVSDRASLTNATYTAVSKGEPLYTARDGRFFKEGLTSIAISCYEGLGLGPRNPDGTYNLMMVSDGGAIANKRWMFLSATAKTQAFIRALRLYGLDDDGSFSVLAPQRTLAQSEKTKTPSWRIGFGGFGRGGIRTDMNTFGKNNRADHYGIEMDVQRNLLQSDKYDLWLGLGGAYGPRQGGAFAGNAAKLSTGEFRLMTIPQRYLTDDFALGLRLGASFNWLNIKSSTAQATAFQDASKSDTQFAAQAILGVQATYMLNDRVGLYGNFDWRLGDEASFNTRAGESTVDMSGWLWSTGAILTF